MRKFTTKNIKNHFNTLLALLFTIGFVLSTKSNTAISTILCACIVFIVVEIIVFTLEFAFEQVKKLMARYNDNSR